MFCALFCQAGVTWKQDEDSNMFWIYIFPVSFAFPLVLPLRLFFLATDISVFFQISSELDHGSCGFERGSRSTIPLPCFLLRVLPSAHLSVPFLYSPCSFLWSVCVLLVSFPLCSFLFSFSPYLFFLSSPSFFFSSPSVSSLSFPFPSVFSPSPLTFLFSPLLFLTLSFSVPFFLFFFSLFSSLSRSPSSVSAPPHCLVPSSVFLFFVVQCWCDCDGEWQWLLEEEDDELTMALAVLVRLSPLLYSFLYRSPLVFPLLSFLSFFIVFLWLL